MRATFLFGLLFLGAGTAGAQVKTIDVNRNEGGIEANALFSVAGAPVSTAKYVKVIGGTPYFNENWMRGKLTLSGGHTYDSIFVKIDLLDHSLLFISKDGVELVATTQIKNVILRDSLTGKTYEFIFSDFLPEGGGRSRGWYQVMVPGKLTLYKQYQKQVNENKPYGSATVEQRITTAEQYLIFHNGEYVKIKKLKDISALLADKQQELNKYADTHHLNNKSGNDLVELVAYYNSLFN